MNMNLETIITETMTRAAAAVFKSKGKTLKDVDMAVLTKELCAEAKVARDAILAQGKDLLDSGRTEWLGALIQVECIEAARRAVARVGV